MLLSPTHSVNSRVVVIAGLVLAVFLSAAGWVLDQAFRDSAMSAVRERLTSNVFLLLGMVDFGPGGEVLIESELPKPEWRVPESGHFAQILDQNLQRVWHSRSMLGIEINAPVLQQPGVFSLREVTLKTGENLFLLSYTVRWETASRPEHPLYTIQTAENEAGFKEQIRRFRRSLWGWFLAISVGFLLVQTVILRWGLKPLRDLAHEVADVEAGAKSELSGQYPVELDALGKNLNTLIRSNTSNVQRYRNALGDLAHSLKTPLAVIKSALENRENNAAVSATVQEQVEQLDKTINYQLQRAAAAGRPGIARPINISSIVNRIANSLRKVYAARELKISVECHAELKFSGDEGDIMEMIGNVADNACKWARNEVRIKVLESVADVSASANRLVIEISDDGMGMPVEKITDALQRGARLDLATEGHGIGLAVVRELCEEVYGGDLEIKSNDHGTMVRISLNA